MLQMEDKNTSIVKYEKNIFIRIFDFFKNKLKKIKNSKNIEIKNEVKKNTAIDEIQTNNINEEKRKETLELYDKLKNGKVNIDSIPAKDLVKFNLLIKEEIRLKKEKIAMQNEEIDNIKYDIRRLEQENTALRNQYKSTVT